MKDGGQCRHIKVISHGLQPLNRDRQARTNNRGASQKGRRACAQRPWNALV